MSVKNKLTITGAAIAAAAAAGGVTYAAIPASDGTISGCVHNTTRALRVVDPGAGQSCSADETALRWKNGITGKVNDADRLDGRDSSQFVRGTAQVINGRLAPFSSGRGDLTLLTLPGIGHVQARCGSLYGTPVISFGFVNKSGKTLVVAAPTSHNNGAREVAANERIDLIANEYHAANSFVIGDGAMGSAQGAIVVSVDVTGSGITGYSGETTQTCGAGAQALVSRLSS